VVGLELPGLHRRQVVGSGVQFRPERRIRKHPPRTDLVRSPRAPQHVAGLSLRSSRNRRRPWRSAEWVGFRAKWRAPCMGWRELSPGTRAFHG
jgi:hypothetical protein